MITEWWYHKAIIGTFFSIYILHPSISKYWWEHWYNVEKKTKFTWGIRMLPCSLPYVLTNSYQTTSWCHMTITWQLRATNVHLHVTLVQNYATLEYVICKPTVLYKLCTMSNLVSNIWLTSNEQWNDNIFRGTIYFYHNYSQSARLLHSNYIIV